MNEDLLDLVEQSGGLSNVLQAADQPQQQPQEKEDKSVIATNVLHAGMQFRNEDAEQARQEAERAEAEEVAGNRRRQRRA